MEKQGWGVVWRHKAETTAGNLLFVCVDSETCMLCQRGTYFVESHYRLVRIEIPSLLLLLIPVFFILREKHIMFLYIQFELRVSGNSKIFDISYIETDFPLWKRICID